MSSDPQDEQVLAMWRSVSGPRAELNGPLIRFAALVRESVHHTVSLHRCKICGTRWLLWPAGVGGTKDASWNLLDKWQRPGSCCDNVAMGEQIEHLRDLPVVTVSVTVACAALTASMFRRKSDVE